MRTLVTMGRGKHHMAAPKSAAVFPSATCRRCCGVKQFERCGSGDGPRLLHPGNLEQESGASALATLDGVRADLAEWLGEVCDLALQLLFEGGKAMLDCHDGSTASRESVLGAKTRGRACRRDSSVNAMCGTVRALSAMNTIPASAEARRRPAQQATATATSDSNHGPIPFAKMADRDPRLKRAGRTEAAAHQMLRRVPGALRIMQLPANAHEAHHCAAILQANLFGG